MTQENKIHIFQTEDGCTQIQVRFEQDTLWLSQAQMAELFDKDSDTIGLHLKNIYESGELEEWATTEDSSAVRQEGKRQVRRKIRFYNLDAVISVGYRVNSRKGTQFRIWATQRLKEYLVQGYALNQQRLEAQREKLAELRLAIALSSRLIHQKQLSTAESQGILTILEQYSLALTVLDDYDHQRLQVTGTRRAGGLHLAHCREQARRAGDDRQGHHQPYQRAKRMSQLSESAKAAFPSRSLGTRKPHPLNPPCVSFISFAGIISRKKPPPGRLPTPRIETSP
jgi:hypothetical protein